ncbi:hypothetical protein SAMN06297251_102156 [Fulvimarina manganoxydans]|uniref:Uncharacterized protein n=1 Tax=Fulvimarina manganoxydans TaxID=937218 RepID=A0A1W1Z5X6_9HYPH|nr:hypothetical protein [Fulvimarina manganoxydans]SMC43338.1 hypothetical protein SAMN06297251_102156 [Fulvimarina manganoxydans]
MSKWFPDRKVLGGGMSAIVAFLLIQIASAAGADIPAEWQAILPTAIGYAVSYLLPPAARDVIARMDDALVEIAAADPKSKVSPAVGEAVKRIHDGT